MMVSLCLVKPSGRYLVWTIAKMRELQCNLRGKRSVRTKSRVNRRNAVPTYSLGMPPSFTYLVLNLTRFMNVRWYYCCNHIVISASCISFRNSTRLHFLSVLFQLEKGHPVVQQSTRPLMTDSLSSGVLVMSSEKKTCISKG